MPQMIPSPVWNYFERLRDEETQEKLAKCNKCQRVYKCAGGTTPMLIHMRTKHKEDYEEFVTERETQSKCKFPSSYSVNETDSRTLDETYEKNISAMSDTDTATLEKIEEPTQAVGSLLLAEEDFSNNLVKVFKKLIYDSEFTNVTLVAGDGTTFSAHKVILSAFSPFFKNVLVGTPNQNSFLYMRGVDSESLKSILDFIYLGHTRVEMQKVKGFMDLANDLQIHGLVKPSDQPLDDLPSEMKEIKSESETQNYCQPRDWTTSDSPTLNMHAKKYQTKSSSKSFKNRAENIQNENYKMKISCNRCSFTTETMDQITEHITEAHDGVN